jgi:hypothetical protein
MATSLLATPSPLSKSDWRALRAELLALQKQAEVASCPICLAQMELGKKALFSTSCGHTFHFECIKRLHIEFAGDAVASACPLCRAPFSSQTPPRTPFAVRAAGLPGFMTARSLMMRTAASTSAVPDASASRTGDSFPSGGIPAGAFSGCSDAHRAASQTCDCSAQSAVSVENEDAGARTCESLEPQAGERLELNAGEGLASQAGSYPASSFPPRTGCLAATVVPIAGSRS